MLGIRLRQPAKRRLAAGTAFPLTLLVAIATLGLETGMLSTAQAPAILLTAIITSLLYPGMFKFIVRLRFVKAET